MAKKKDIKPFQQESPVEVNLVREGLTPEDPDYVDKEKTLEARKMLSKDGKLPKMIQSLHNAFGTNRAQVIQPTEREVALLSQTVTDTCGGCRAFDYEEAQQCLWQEGGFATMFAMNPKITSAIEMKEFGYCERTKGFVDARAPGCEEFQAKRKGVFGRILGGVWKRKNDI